MIAAENFLQILRNAFVRRVAFTAVRFMAQAGQKATPDVTERAVVAALNDPNPWVRYDAAWAAPMIECRSSSIITDALEAMISKAQANAETAEKVAAPFKALERAEKNLAELRAGHPSQQ